MRKFTYDIAVLACAALALTGCNKLEKFDWMTGGSIKFGVSTQGDAVTKTAYGDITTQTVSGETKKIHQMIDWKENDVIRIVCEQASTVEEGTKTTADYKTSAGTKTGTESRATLSLASSNDKGLRWGDQNVDHKFYAVYPSPVTTGKSGDTLTVGGILNGNIPQSQSVTVSGSGPYEASVDMTNQYLVAKRTVKQKDFNNNEVFLYFTPITTAIEFEVTNSMEDNSSLVIESIELESASHYLSGTFSTSLTGLTETGASYSNYPTVTGISGLNKTAKVSFGTPGFTLTKDNTLTFTIFLLPESNLNDLTFRINKTDGTYIQTALKSDASTWISFGRCKKHFVKGLFVNDGAKWTLAFSPYVDNWGDTTGIDQDLEDPPLGSLPSLIQWSQGEVSSLKLKESGKYVFALTNGTSDASHTFSGDLGDMTSTKRVKTIPITSTLDDDNQAWKIKSVDGVTLSSGAVSYTTADSIKVEKNTDGDLVITDKREKVSNGDHKHWTDNSAGNVWYSQSWGSETGGLNKGTVDLSKYDFQSDTPNAHSMRTANCYIVRHAGTYKIPLVYGNAIDYVKNTSTGVNTDAYNPSGVTSGANVLKPFVNNKGNIISPFIENNRKDGGTSFSNSSRFVASSASVIWQDNPDVGITVSVTSHSAGTGQCTSSNCGYIKLTVDPATIAQCNAMIAVKDASNNILWSWHIWITNDPALGNSDITVNNGTQSYNFFPVTCLGWLEPQMYEEKPNVEIVLEQEESGETITVTVKQKLYDSFYSNGTYYQWGRKDPMPSAEITNYSIFSGQATLVADGISAPNKFYMFNGNWYSTNNYYNLWTGKETTTGDIENSSSMVKTVYDPSPVGYKVPAPNAFSSLTTANSTGDFNKGMYFYTTSAKVNTIFFATCGYDSRSSGIKTSQGSAYYWSSITDNNDNRRGRRFYFSSSTEPNLGNNNKTEGFAIRPVTE